MAVALFRSREKVEAKENTEKFRELERQAQGNWTRCFLPFQLLYKHNFDVTALKSEIQNHRIIAEEQYQRCESLALEAMKSRDKYEPKSQEQVEKGYHMARTGATIAGGFGSLALTGGADGGAIPLVAGEAAYAGTKRWNEWNDCEEAYKEMNSARDYFRRAGYSY